MVHVNIPDTTFALICAVNVWSATGALTMQLTRTYNGNVQLTTANNNETPQKHHNQHVQQFIKMIIQPLTGKGFNYSYMTEACKCLQGMAITSMLYNIQSYCKRKHRYNG